MVSWWPGATHHGIKSPEKGFLFHLLRLRSWSLPLPLFSMSSHDNPSMFSPAESCGTPFPSTSQNSARRKVSVSREECRNCLDFLNTPAGQTFLQNWHELLQARKNPNCQEQMARLSEKAKFNEYEARKSEIFYYYMQDFSAKSIKEELKADGYEFSTRS